MQQDISGATHVVPYIGTDGRISLVNLPGGRRQPGALQLRNMLRAQHRNRNPPTIQQVNQTAVVAAAVAANDYRAAVADPDSEDDDDDDDYNFPGGANTDDDEGGGGNPVVAAAAEAAGVVFDAVAATGAAIVNTASRMGGAAAAAASAAANAGAGIVQTLSRMRGGAAAADAATPPGVAGPGGNLGGLQNTHQGPQKSKKVAVVSGANGKNAPSDQEAVRAARSLFQASMLTAQLGAYLQAENFETGAIKQAKTLITNAKRNFTSRRYRLAYTQADAAEAAIGDAFLRLRDGPGTALPNDPEFMERADTLGVDAAAAALAAAGKSVGQIPALREAIANGRNLHTLMRKNNLILSQEEFILRLHGMLDGADAAVAAQAGNGEGVHNQLEEIPEVAGENDADGEEEEEEKKEGAPPEGVAEETAEERAARLAAAPAATKTPSKTPSKAAAAAGEDEGRPSTPELPAPQRRPPITQAHVPDDTFRTPTSLATLTSASSAMRAPAPVPAPAPAPWTLDARTSPVRILTEGEIEEKVKRADGYMSAIRTASAQARRLSARRDIDSSEKKRLLNLQKDELLVDLRGLARNLDAVSVMPEGVQGLLNDVAADALDLLQDPAVLPRDMDELPIGGYVADALDAAARLRELTDTVSNGDPEKAGAYDVAGRLQELRWRVYGSPAGMAMGTGALVDTSPAVAPTPHSSSNALAVGMVAGPMGNQAGLVTAAASSQSAAERAQAAAADVSTGPDHVLADHTSPPGIRSTRSATSSRARAAGVEVAKYREMRRAAHAAVAPKELRPVWRR